MIGQELVAEIVRLHVVEGWRPGTIGRHLGIHRDTVKAALRRAGVKVNRSARRPSKIDRFEAFVRETFERYHNPAEPEPNRNRHGRAAADHWTW